MTPTIGSGYCSVGRHHSTGVDEEGRKCCILLATKMQGTYLSGAGGQEPTIFDFDLDIVCFILSFFLWVLLVSCLLGFGFCRDSLSIWSMYLDKYVRGSHLFSFFVWGTRFASVTVCIIFCFSCVSSWGNLPLQSYWRSLSCDHGLHCSDELMWEQQQQQHVTPDLS